MIIVANFDPSAGTTSTFTVPQNEGKMVVWNESNISLELSFQNGYTAYVPAWTAVLFCGPWGSGTVTWAQQKILNASSPPISQVVVEVYAVGEPVPGTFPMALTRQTNIGNSVNTVGGSATSVQNDNNVAGTSVVEATVSGDASSAVSLTNQGHLTLGTVNNNGSLSITGLHGNVSVDANGVLTVDFHLVANLVIAEANNDIGFHVGAGQRIIDTVNGVNMVQTDANGFNLLAGTINLREGSFQRIARFTGVTAAGKVTVNHGLSVVPDLVEAFFIVGSLPSPHIIACNHATLTATQVDVWSDVNGIGFEGFAIKF